MNFNKVIAYQGIAACAQSIDKSRPNIVRVSRYQAWLFRSKLKLLVNAGDKGAVTSNILDTLHFSSVVGAILLTCPKVAFLADYFDFDSNVFQRIEFEETSGGVFIKFHPREKTRSL